MSLRRAMQHGKPLIWFIGVAPGVFHPVAPVWLSEEEPSQHQFVVALDEWMLRGWQRDLVDTTVFNPARRYADVVVRLSLGHQAPDPVWSRLTPSRVVAPGETIR